MSKCSVQVLLVMVKTHSEAVQSKKIRSDLLAIHLVIITILSGQEIQIHLGINTRIHLPLEVKIIILLATRVQIPFQIKVLTRFRIARILFQAIKIPSQAILIHFKLKVITHMVPNHRDLLLGMSNQEKNKKELRIALL